MGKTLFSLFMFSMFLVFIGLPAQAETHQLTITVKSSSDADLHTTLVIRGNAIVQKVENGKETMAIQPLPLTDMYITVGDRHFIMDRKKNLFDLGNEARLWLPNDVEQRLFHYAQLLRKEHYGELLPWEKADQLIPKKATFTVVDLKTGKNFKVQRRAGSSHADVQPLTREDTKTMKAIYNDHWSWRRRAILVKTDGRTIAASMHGMPHGAGALQNGFPGHFCIHFFGSSTHRSEKVDPAHEVMVYQAAGKIYSYLENATPYEVVDAFFVAVNQHDNHLLKMTLSRENGEEIKKLLNLLKNAEAINNTSSLMENDINTSIGVNIPVDTRIYWSGRGVSKKTLTFLVRRDAPGERWHIDADALLKSLE